MLVAVIPAYNEARAIEDVLIGVRDVVDAMIVIDDGSSDTTSAIALRYTPHVVHHAINRGLGATLKTGFDVAGHLGATMVVTIDGDGQLDPHDIPRAVARMNETSADVVIGSRMLVEDSGMPLIRKIYNHIGNWYTAVLFGIRVTDSQSGLRLFRATVLPHLRLVSDHMAISSEIIAELGRNHFRIAEIPITVRYNEYTMNKPRSQNFLEGIQTAWKLLLKKIL